MGMNTYAYYISWMDHFDGRITVLPAQVGALNGGGGGVGVVCRI